MSCLLTAMVRGESRVPEPPAKMIPRRGIILAAGEGPSSFAKASAFAEATADKTEDRGARGERLEARGLGMRGSGFNETTKHLGHFFAECVQLGELFLPNQQAFKTAAIYAFRIFFGFRLSHFKL